MRIGIGAIAGIVGGPATYARELVAALAREAQGWEFVVFTDRPAAFAAAGVETVAVPLPSPYHQVLWDHLRLPGLLRRRGITLYHGTKNVLPWRLPCPAVLTVHDLAVYACPESFALPQRWHLRALVPASVRRARLVIADSEHARRDLITRLGLAPQRAVAIPLAPGPAFRPLADRGEVERFRRRYGLGRQVVAVVGTVQPRKRVDLVIAAFRATGAAERGWELVIAGRRRPGFHPRWLSREGMPPGVRWLGPLSTAEIVCLDNLAEVVVSASLYEGFGLSVLEAMACGTAVVAAETSSLPEVVGEAGILVSPGSLGELAAALERVLGDAALRAELAERALARARQFSWADTARRTLRVYEQGAGSATAGAEEQR